MQGAEVAKGLANRRRVAIGEYDRAASLDDGWILRGHDVGTEIQLARRYADHGNQQGRSQPHHHDLEVGIAVSGVHGPVHDILRGSCSFVT